jgi:hypothetical protein
VVVPLPKAARLAGSGGGRLGETSLPEAGKMGRGLDRREGERKVEMSQRSHPGDKSPWGSLERVAGVVIGTGFRRQGARCGSLD